MARIMHFRTRLSFVICTAALLLSACSSVDKKDSVATDSLEASRAARNIPALLEAPYKTTLVCHSTKSLSVNTPFKSILFNCADFSAQATIDELRDAGWRTEAVDIGKPENKEGVVEMTLRITLKKIF